MADGKCSWKRFDPVEKHYKVKNMYAAFYHTFTVNFEPNRKNP